MNCNCPSCEMRERLNRNIEIMGKRDGVDAKWVKDQQTQNAYYLQCQNKPKLTEAEKVFSLLVAFGFQAPEDCREYRSLSETDKQKVYDLWSRHWAGEPLI